MKALSIFLVLSAALFAAESRQEADAQALFQDAEARLQTQRYGTAAVAFQTLIAVYPESPLVPRAVEGLHTARKLEMEQTHSRIVRSLQFRNLGGLNQSDILKRFDDREIELGVDKPCDPKLLDEAKSALQELLSERGVPASRLEVSTHQRARTVAIIFRLAKN